MIKAHIRILAEFGEIIKPTVKVSLIKNDPDDNKVLECAASCNADYIVSGDSHLLPFKEYKGTKIVSAKSFLDLL